MSATVTDLLERAEAAYQRAVQDPCGQSELPDLVAEARQARAPEALVVALRAHAWCARHQLAARQAKTRLDEAVRVAERHDLSRRLAEVLVTRAAVHHEMGRIDAAQRDLDRARAAGPSAELDLQQAVLFHNTGRLSSAAELYRRLLRAPLSPVMRGKVANNLALIESGQGSYASALHRLDRLLRDADRLGPALAAAVEDSRGWVTVQSGRLVEGLRRLASAAETHERAGLPLGEHYLEHTDALIELRLLPEAVAMATRALQEFERNDVQLLAGEAQLRLARLGLLTGDASSGASAGSAAAQLFCRQRRTSWAARARVVEIQALDALGREQPSAPARLCRAARLLERAGLATEAADAYLAAGRSGLRTGRPSALDSLSRAQTLCRKGPALVRLRGRVAAATSAQVRGAEQEALAHCRAGLADLEQHRAALPSAELRALAADHGVELGRLALASLLPHAPAGQVLQWLERTRAAAFLVAEPPDTEGVEQDVEQLRSVQEELAAARSQGEEPLALLTRQKSLEGRIRRASWLRRDGRGAAAGAATSLADLRRALGGRTLVEYGVHDGQLFAVTLTPRRARLVPLVAVEEVEAEARRVLFAVRRLAQPAPPALSSAFLATARQARARLAAWLVHPLGLTAGEPVVVVPTARTWGLPWSALHDAPVSLAPSAALWARTASRPSPPAGGRVVLVAGPELAGASDEVTALATLHPAGTVLTPPQSTVDTVLAALGTADLAHLACHGRLRSDNPTFSAFQLCGGELTLHELHARRAAPHRVVLSACESGTGASYAGDELVGFATALLARGTAGLLASCVSVSDAAVVPLMCAVHQSLLRGDRLAEALHTAKSVLDPDDAAGLATAYAFNACGAA